MGQAGPPEPDTVLPPQRRVTFVLRLHLEASPSRRSWRGTVEQVPPDGEVFAVEAALPLYAFLRRRLRAASGVGLPLLRPFRRTA